MARNMVGRHAEASSTSGVIWPLAKDPSAAGVDACGGDKQLDGRCDEALEIDALGQHPTKRVEARGLRS